MIDYFGPTDAVLVPTGTLEVSGIGGCELHDVTAHSRQSDLSVQSRLKQRGS